MWWKISYDCIRIHKIEKENLVTNFCNIYIYASTNSLGWERKIKAICEEFCLRMCVSCGNAEPRINCTCSQHPFFSEYFIITMKNIQRVENCSRVYPDHPFPSIQNSMQRKLVYFLIFLKSRWEPCLSHKLALVLKIPKKLHKSANCEPVSWLVSVILLLLLLLLLCAKPPQSVLASPDEVSALTDPGNDDWNKIVSLDPPPGCWSAGLPGLRYLNSVKTLPAFPITISQHSTICCHCRQTFVMWCQPSTNI